MVVLIMFIPTPSHFKISSGIGKSRLELVAFDNALMSAGISNYNLVKVSSILPSGCTQENEVSLKHGSILHTAYGSFTSNISGQTIASAVSIAIPQNDEIGIIMEHAGLCRESEARSIVTLMAEEAMRNHGIPIKHILCSSIETTAEENTFFTVISAVTMW